MSRHEEHGYEILVSFGLKPKLYHIFKRLSTERDDENSHDCVSVCATQCLPGGGGGTAIYGLYRYVPL